MSPQAKDRNKTFVIDEHVVLPYDASRAWAAIADPVSYFTWNPAATLMEPLTDFAREMHLKIDSPILGKTTYQHRIDPEKREVLHEVTLRTRFLNLGHELHTWRVTERTDGKPGCVVHQTMEVHLTTFVSRLLAGALHKQFHKVFKDNFKLIGDWLGTAPALVEERRQMLHQALGPH